MVDIHTHVTATRVLAGHWTPSGARALLTRVSRSPNVTSSLSLVGIVNDGDMMHVAPGLVVSVRCARLYFSVRCARLAVVRWARTSSCIICRLYTTSARRVIQWVIYLTRIHVLGEFDYGIDFWNTFSKDDLWWPLMNYIPPVIYNLQIYVWCMGVYTKGRGEGDTVYTHTETVKCY
jgi:hypothetical protein